MSNIKRVKSQAGFSLIELMVVVAIIGVLAAIAVPNFQRFQAKAKQSEAKNNLSALYSAEKAFFGEWSMYDTDFNVIGFRPEGRMMYIAGFKTVKDNTAAITNYTGVTVNDGSDTNTWCTNAAANGSCTNQAKGAQADAPGAKTTITIASTCDGNQGTNATFTAAAEGWLLNAVDTWTMTQNKVVANPTSGL